MMTLQVNGKPHEIDADPTTPLLYVLRDHLRLNGAKFGCGLGQCGSCTVMIDGAAAYSCLIPISALQNRQIKTIEGLGTLENPGPLQRAFIEAQAAQCGYCIPGMMMRAQALLERSKSPPSTTEIKDHLRGHLCRCGTHMRIVRAIERAAREMKGGTPKAGTAS